MHQTIALCLAGLSPALLDSGHMPNLDRLRNADGHTYRPLASSFPAVTSSVQATMLSGVSPAQHGIVANGWFDRDMHVVDLWAQPDALCEAPRVWDELGPQGKRTGVICWQQSMYINADVVISPRPQHTDQGMIEWCYSKPPGLYEDLIARDRPGPFTLKSYWGPLTSEASSRWVADAGLAVAKEQNLDLLLVYLPHLDYNTQRFGPDIAKLAKDLAFADSLVGEYMQYRENRGVDKTDLIVLSEYGIAPVNGAVFPNRVLREAGLLQVREIAPAGEYLIDTEYSRAFAIVDHQVAHVYVRNPADIKEVQALLSKTAGVDQVLDKQAQAKFKVDHARSGELVLMAKPDKWFAYYWWLDDAKAPRFARTVDIHNKPGYDPVELFVDMPTKSIPLDASLVKGSHGLPPKTADQFGVFIATDDFARSPSALESLRENRPLPAETVAALLKLSVLAS